MSKNSVLEELRVRRLAVIQEEMYIAPESTNESGHITVPVPGAHTGPTTTTTTRARNFNAQ